MNFLQKGALDALTGNEALMAWVKFGVHHHVLKPEPGTS